MHSVPYQRRTMQLNDTLIRNVVQEVLAAMGQAAAATVVAQEKTASRNGRFGIFSSVDDAVTAAVAAQGEFERRPIEDRNKAIECIRRICKDQAEELGR